MDRVIQIIIDLLQSLATEGIQFLLERAYTIPTAIYVTILALVVFAYISLLLRHLKLKNMLGRICIREKEYYDILEDVIFFRNGSSRNKFDIDELHWDFSLIPNASNSLFLDLDARWRTKFSANLQPVKEVKIGIRGGCFWKEKNYKKISACQGDSPITPLFEGKQGDYGTVRLPLNSHIPAKGKSDVEVKYISQKFMISDPDYSDDYFYIFPISQAKKVKRILINIKHPYKCKPRIYVLKRNLLLHTYSQTELLDDSQSHQEHNFQCSTMNEFMYEHSFRFYSIDPFDVLLIAFEQENDFVNCIGHPMVGDHGS